MSYLTRVLFLGVVMLWCFPLFAQAQTRKPYGEYQGVVREFVYDDPRLTSDTVKRPSEFSSNYTADYKYRLYTGSSFIELAGGVDWDQYVNRSISVQGSISTRGPLKVLSAKQQTIQTLDESPYFNLSLPPVTQGTLKVLSVVIVVQQPGAMSADSFFLTEEQVLAPVVNNPKSAKRFWAEASASSQAPAGRLQIGGLQNPNSADVAFVTIISDITNCDQHKSSDWPIMIDAQLRAQSIEPNNYNATIFVYDDIPGCSTQSGASIGHIGLLNSRQWVYTNRTAMVNSLSDYMVTHELGHVMGLQHSSAYQCTDQNNIPGSCIWIEYGDSACIMGEFEVMPNVYQRRRLGWYDQPFKQLAFSGKYHIFSPSAPAFGATKGIMSCQFCYIPLTGTLVGSSEYIEARRNYGLFDNFDGNNGLTVSYKKGVKLLIGTDDLANSAARPFILDTTPFDTSTYNAPLVLSSYTIGGIVASHVELTTIAKGSAVQITLPQ